MEHLFVHRRNLEFLLRNRRLLLFLDYDGTLAPIARTPQQANLPQKTRKLLSGLAESPRCKLVIISGRALEDIKKAVGLKGIIYVGNHGLAIEGRKIKFQSQITPKIKKIIAGLRDELSHKLQGMKGAFVEDKGLTLTLHYRLVDKNLLAKVKTIFHETVINHLAGGRIKIKPGKMALEVRPAVEWDKGKAVLWLLYRERFFLKDENILPVYLGDDETDEDAFRALKNKGLTIFVGAPQDSHARYYLKNTQEVADFLELILRVQGE